MKLGFRIAIRFLKSNKGQTILIILGIAIGVSVQIFIGSLIQGLQKGLIDKTVGSSPHITVTLEDEDKDIKDYEDVVKELELEINQIEAPIKVISVADDHPALLEFDGDSKSVLVRGFEIDEAQKIYKIKDKIVQGEEPKDENEVLVGVNLKEEFGLNLGDKISLISAEQSQSDCDIVGFYDLEVASINESWIITNLETSKNIFDTQDTINSIELQVEEDFVFEVDVLASQLSTGMGTDYIFENWKDQNQQLLSGLKGQSTSSAVIQVFVMISVLLGIASVLAITVLQKSRQIGILKAMGLKNKSTSYIFLFEGLILGFFGAAVGVGLGVGLSYAFTTFVVNPDGTPVVDLYISTSFVITSGLVAVGASVIASLIPAVRSSKLNPIDIIRNN